MPKRHKRRRLVPILDSVMVACYSEARDARRLAESYVPRSVRRSALVSVLEAIQADVRQTNAELGELATDLATQGWPVSTLRVHDIVVWTEREDRGYYRDPPA